MATIAQPNALNLDDAWAAYQDRGAAVIVPTFGSTLRHAGVDTLDLLHRLTTNSVVDLQDGASCQTILTNEKGRIVDVFWVVKQSTDELLLLSDSPDPSPTLEWIDRYTIIEDAELSDVSDQMARWYVVGPKATTALADAFSDQNFFSTSIGSMVELGTNGSETGFALRTDSPAQNTWIIVCARSEETVISQKLGSTGLPTASNELFHYLRVRSQSPIGGSDLTLEVNPLEAGLMDLVDFEKGCYVGQEVIARLDTYEKVQRELVGFSQTGQGLDGHDVAPQDQITTQDATRSIGWISSVARKPKSDDLIGLAFIRKSHSQPGTDLTTDRGGMIKVLPRAI